MKENYITIVSFVCNDNLTVLLVFSDGTRQTIDIGGFIRSHPHPQYNKYLNPCKFKKCHLEDGNIVWGNDLEFHLEDLYAGHTEAFGVDSGR